MSPFEISRSRSRPLGIDAVQYEKRWPTSTSTSYAGCTDQGARLWLRKFGHTHKSLSVSLYLAAAPSRLETLETADDEKSVSV